MAAFNVAVFLLGLQAACGVFIRPCSAFTNSANTGSYKIVGAAGGVQHLPASYSTTFSFWTYENSRLISLNKEPASNNDEQDYMIRASIDIFIKGSTPAYIMAGLQTNQQTSTPSPVLAQQWTTFNTLSVEPNVRLLVYQGAGDGTDERLVFVPHEKLKDAIETLGMLLSSSASEALRTGFHVVSFPLGEWTTVNDSKSAAKFTCVITAEPDPREIFTLDPELVEMTAVSFLQAEL